METTFWGVKPVKKICGVKYSSRSYAVKKETIKAPAASQSAAQKFQLHNSCF
jgi:hypothetical protein